MCDFSVATLFFTHPREGGQDFALNSIKNNKFGGNPFEITWSHAPETFVCNPNGSFGLGLQICK